MVPLAMAGLEGQPSLVLAAQPVEGEARALFLITQDGAQGFRIRHLARVVTARDVPEPPPQGYAEVVGTEGRVQELADSYAQSLGASSNPAFDPDDYARRARGRLASLRDRIGRAGQISQENRLVPDSLEGLRFPSGQTLVLAGVERTTSLTVSPGSHPRLPAGVSVLAGDRSAVLQQAKWIALAFLVWTVPESGRPRLVAASEQEVSASGH